MKTIEEVVSSTAGATVFSVLDAKQGFLQISLDENSSFLTTFNTPIGRYRWLRLPFGIKCAPEIFQRIMDQMLEGIAGAIAIMDDILIAGKDKAQHDAILKKVLERAASYNLKLNHEKCQLRQESVKYVGHIISKQGLHADPEKIAAVKAMPTPLDKAAVKRFLGFVTYLSKFIPNLSQVCTPLRQLVKDGNDFNWGPAQTESFEELKRLCTSSPVLAFYDVHKPVEIQCDASKDGLGSVLLQDGKPVAYSSRAMTKTESNYAQIEKEMLSIVHAVTKFHCYVFGRHCTVFNDHKPLEAIFKKPLNTAPMRLQRMLLKLQWYDINVQYQKGETMHLSDTLSGAYIHATKSEHMNLDDVNMLDFISITPHIYGVLQKRTEEELDQLRRTIKHGFPDTRQELATTLRKYWDVRDHMSYHNGIIYKGLRIVVPRSLQKHMIELIHKSHLGIVKCKQRAREVLYWPAMNADIETAVKDCETCASHQNKLQREPLKPTVMPDFPFCEVGTDLFDLGSKKYLVLVDYYSKFVEVDELKATTTGEVIQVLQAQFCRHGIPRVLRSDNGPQFSSREFATFCKAYQVQHLTCSPHHQQANGEAGTSHSNGKETVEEVYR